MNEIEERLRIFRVPQLRCCETLGDGWAASRGERVAHYLTLGHFEKAPGSSPARGASFGQWQLDCHFPTIAHKGKFEPKEDFVTWTIEEIEREWGATAPFPEIVVDAFERAERVLGRDWIESTRLIPGGQVSGPSALLKVVSMGGQLSVLEAVKGAERLVAKLKSHDSSAEAELTAMHLLHGRNKESEIEYEPDTANGRKSDFRIRLPGEGWTYVEVTRPNISEARQRLMVILNQIIGLVREIQREFALEVFFRREPEDSEIEKLLDRARQFCAKGLNQREEVDDLALLILSDVTPGQIVPQQETGDHATPRLGAAMTVVGTGEPRRHVVARIPYSDKRADKFLSNEAAQLSKNHPGLIMVDASGEPTTFSSWGAVLARRFQPSIHTRVSGVCLFAPQLIPMTGTLVWVPAVQIHINSHAKLALPSWISSALLDAKNDFGTLLAASRTRQQ